MTAKRENRKKAKQDKATPRVKDLAPNETAQEGLRGGTTRHDTAKNSISNVR